jgi:hypothetical protein
VLPAGHGVVGAETEPKTGVQPTPQLLSTTTTGDAAVLKSGQMTGQSDTVTVAETVVVHVPDVTE